MASKSTTFPFPSSPHCAPRTTVTLFCGSFGTRREDTCEPLSRGRFTTGSPLREAVSPPLTLATVLSDAMLLLLPTNRNCFSAFSATQEVLFRYFTTRCPHKTNLKFTAVLYLFSSYIHSSYSHSASYKQPIVSLSNSLLSYLAIILLKTPSLVKRGRVSYGMIPVSAFPSSFNSA